MQRSHAAHVNNEILRVAFSFDVPEPPEISWFLYQSFPTPLKDPNKNLWWPTKPYLYSIKRVRFEVVSNLNRFIESEKDVVERIKSGCVAVIDKIHEMVASSG